MNPLLIIGGVGLGLGLVAGIEILNAAVGCIALNMLGYGAIVAAAGAFWPVAWAIALGTLALLIPLFIALAALQQTLGKDHPLLPLLTVVVSIGTAFAAGVVGAGFLGLAANPVGLITLAGAIPLNLLILAIKYAGQLMSSACLSQNEAESTAELPLATVVATEPLIEGQRSGLSNFAWGTPSSSGLFSNPSANEARLNPSDDHLTDIVPLFSSNGRN